jgi:hypothetical protein
MLDAQPIEATATEAGFKLPGLRWWIVGLIFLATLINYIDRLTISVLAPVITHDLGLTNTEFGGIITWFLLAIVRGDATAAYEPELGLKKFVREFVYKPSTGFTVSDEVETTKPAVLTFLLHADDHIEKGEGCEFSIRAGRVKLLIDPTLAAPVEQALQSIEAVIETNNLTAPGPPGAVDKGERQARGQKLLLSTAVPTTRAQFNLRLRVEE